MAKIEIYTTNTCPYCHAAKELLNQKAASFTEISVVGDAKLRSTM
jgi:glutaredoxin 3